MEKLITCNENIHDHKNLNIGVNFMTNYENPFANLKVLLMTQIFVTE